MITTNAELEERIGTLMVRHHYSRHAATGVALALVGQTVIDGTCTDTRQAVDRIAPDDLQYVSQEESAVNPFRFHAAASALVMGVTGLGAGWSVLHHYTRTDVAAGVFFLTILLFALLQGRSNAWEQA